MNRPRKHSDLKLAMGLFSTKHAFISCFSADSNAFQYSDQFFRYAAES